VILTPVQESSACTCFPSPRAARALTFPRAPRGAIATFATEATGFGRAYPGIRPHLLTLTSNFTVPFYRDVLLALGICSVSKRSCANILKRGAGEAITIVVGGAAESLSAHPGTADLTLRKRCAALPLARCPARV
jgi:2-acylglycerol O-acyltransferase 2